LEGKRGGRIGGDGGGGGDGSCRATVVAVVVGRCAMKTKTGNKRKEEGEVIPNSSIQEGNIEFLP
jgi:hypothetical protein